VSAQAAAGGDVARDPLESIPRSAREALRPRPNVGRRKQASPEHRARFEAQQRERETMLGAYGERPVNPFGGVPVAEIAIVAGAVALIYGWIAKAGVALVVGSVVCTLGVAEFSVREHFSGYRSHSLLLAGIPAIAALVIIVLVGGLVSLGPLLIVVALVFIVCFWQLRKRFRAARHARIARPPAP
jgi:hypothetical protein